ncbi:MAG: hypothetical protein PUP90_12455 [Nostoc sp. S4]|nr:hypothetical protein [Nostoc sp. S4]
MRVQAPLEQRLAVRPGDIQLSKFTLFYSTAVIPKYKPRRSHGTIKAQHR